MADNVKGGFSKSRQEKKKKAKRRKNTEKNSGSKTKQNCSSSSVKSNVFHEVSEKYSNSERNDRNSLLPEKEARHNSESTDQSSYNDLENRAREFSRRQVAFSSGDHDRRMDEPECERNHYTDNFTVHNYVDIQKIYYRDHDIDRKSEMGFHKRNNNPRISYLLQNVEHLTNQVNFLSQENSRLTDALCNMRCNWSVLSDSEVDIIFKRRDLEDKFLPLLKDLVSDLISGGIQVEDLQKFYTSAKSKKQDEESEDNLFSLDFSTVSEPDANSSIPKYEKSFSEILQNEETNKDSESKKYEKKIPKICFNCSEDHFINKCPYRIDQHKVSVARKRTKPFISNVRYHVHEGKKYEFKPGVISDELKEALNLHKNQVPLYIYRMRVINYPPGWLNEAAVESSGITMYGSDGNAEQQNGEEGEIETTSMRVQYDPDKLVDYPGFNVPLSPDFIDESERLGFPPLQTHQLRCMVEKTMDKPVICPKRKRKLELADKPPSKRERLDDDMDLDENLDGGIIENNEEFVPPLPSDTPPPPPPPDDPSLLSADSSDAISHKAAGSQSDVSSDNQESSSTFRREPFVHRLKIKGVQELSSGKASPSLTELEELKSKLVKELELSSSDTLGRVLLDEFRNDTEQNANSEVGSPEYPEEFVTLESSNDGSGYSDCSASSEQTGMKESNTLNASPCSETSEFKASKSKFMTLGTPSLSKHSPFSKLPDYEQFSKNVASHLNFENLPNSTGTYSKLKGVLKKVKETLNSFMP